MRRPYERTVKPNGSILIRVVVGYAGKKPIRVSETFPAGTSAAVIDQWAYTQKALNPYDHRKPGRRLNPDTIIDAWLISKTPSISNRTAVNYESYARLYLKGRLRSFDRLEVASLIGSLRRANGNPLSPKTLQTVRVLLKNVMQYAREEDLISEIPKIPDIAGSKRVKSIQVFQPHQVLRLKRVLTLENELALETLLLTGMRVSELLALEPRHVLRTAVRVEQTLRDRWGSREVTTPKTANAYRTITIPVGLRDRLKKLVDSLPDGERFIFSVGQSGLTKRLKKVCAANNLPAVSLHVLRHTHCTHLLGKGVSVVAVSRRLGHHNPAFTLRTYAHLIPDMDERLNDVLDALNAFDESDKERGALPPIRHRSRLP